LKEVASFALMVVEYLPLVDNGDILVMDEIPPVLPVVDLCGVTQHDFARALKIQMDRLLEKVFRG
jgi:hypothetical protein